MSDNVKLSDAIVTLPTAPAAAQLANLADQATAYAEAAKHDDLVLIRDEDDPQVSSYNGVPQRSVYPRFVLKEAHVGKRVRITVEVLIWLRLSTSTLAGSMAGRLRSMTIRWQRRFGSNSTFSTVTMPTSRFVFVSRNCK